MNNNNYKEVIQFVTPGQKYRIDEGFYIPKEEWNPDNKIQLVTFENAGQLVQNGVILKGDPDYNDAGRSTFIQNPINPCEYIPIKDYGDYITEQKEGIMVQILAQLGIRDYYVRSECYLEAGYGNKINKQAEVSGGASYIAEAGGKSSYKSNSGLDITFSKKKSKHKVFDPFIPTMENWEKAVELANKCNLYDKLSSIINTRKPGENNPQLLMDQTDIDIDGDFSFRFSVASKLQAFAGYKGFSAMGSFLSALDFNVFAHIHYRTHIMYNFDPNREDPEIVEAIRLEKEEQNK